MKNLENPEQETVSVALLLKDNSKLVTPINNAISEAEQGVRPVLEIREEVEDILKDTNYTLEQIIVSGKTLDEILKTSILTIEELEGAFYEDGNRLSPYPGDQGVEKIISLSIEDQLKGLLGANYSPPE